MQPSISTSSACRHLNFIGGSKQNLCQIRLLLYRSQRMREHLKRKNKMNLYLSWKLPSQPFCEGFFRFDYRDLLPVLTTTKYPTTIRRKHELLSAVCSVLEHQTRKNSYRNKYKPFVNFFSSTSSNRTSQQSEPTTVTATTSLKMREVDGDKQISGSVESNVTPFWEFGRLWGRGYEIFYDFPEDADALNDDRLDVVHPPIRRIIQVKGSGATDYLQNLVTADLNADKPPEPRKEFDFTPDSFDGVPHNHVVGSQQTPINNRAPFNPQLRPVCFLDHKGRIITDALVWKISTEEYYVDVPATAFDILFQHLKQYKLRKSAVSIIDTTEQMPSAVIFGTLASKGAPQGYHVGIDPRHPSLGMRVLRKLQSEGPTFRNMFKNNKLFPEMPGNYEFVRRVAGIAEGIEITLRVALEANQEYLNAVSFNKGCYLGQELTARVYHTGVVRKRVVPLYLIDTQSEVPLAWSRAYQMQQDRFYKKYTVDELMKLPSRLPRMSVFTAGTIQGIMSGQVPEESLLQHQAESIKITTDPDTTTDGNSFPSVDPEWIQKVTERSEKLMDDMQISCQKGSKIIDKSTGGTIGQVVSVPLRGTIVVLALMRLDVLGLLKGGTWSRTNKILIRPPSNSEDISKSESVSDGTKKVKRETVNSESVDNELEHDVHSLDSSEREFRFLPYLPLWWPDVNVETGKAMKDGDLPFLPDEVKPEE
jgi:transferase CAF17, mitochondrial